jgi:hypothetical protein
MTDINRVREELRNLQVEVKLLERGIRAFDERFRRIEARDIGGGAHSSRRVCSSPGYLWGTEVGSVTHPTYRRAGRVG